jgi:hypothetical protein
LECSTDADCERLYRRGSKCIDFGICSNPFVSGCLNTMNPVVHGMRLCNSDDKSQENCRTSFIEYPEIRVHNQDWEVAIILSWIVQVYLMEFLNVPVTVGLGDDTPIASFYSTSSALPYSRKSYSFEAIRKANELGGNCILTDEDCIHVIPDVWLGQRDTLLKAFDDGQIDYLDSNGQVGKISWYIPAFTAARHPLTVTYLGMEGKREELAGIFKRPTTWADYCHEVSESNCSQADGIADWYPSEEEKGKYFASGYIGHFRDTAKNNCTGAENNNTCTGHIVNAPCSWSTFLEAQAYYNNIPLESDGPSHVNGGYSYGEMLQIWDAANATRSDVIMWWYEPDPAVEAFRETDFAFTKVHLPSPSVECRESRVSPEDRCSADPLVRRGAIEGSCDNIGHTTKKVIASSLRDTTASTPEVDKSPGYSAIRNFNIDDLDLIVILKNYVDNGKTAHAAREAVCEWVHDNVDLLQQFTPIGYPRQMLDKSDSDRRIAIAAQVIGVIATLYVLVAFALTYKMRKARIFVCAQVQFIFIILFGLLLVALSAVLHSVPPNDNFCVAQFWLVALGYTCELAPLIIKVSAMNHLMRASRRMRRVRINPSALYAKVIFLTLLVAIYLIVWTAADPPSAIEFRTLSEDQMTISVQPACSSNSDHWVTIYHFWEGSLILWALVLAFQSRNAKAEFNESRSVGTMIYSHFVFAALRVVVLLVFEDDPQTTAIGTSFFLSFDVISALTLYLIPKWINAKDPSQDSVMTLHLSESVMSIQDNVDDDRERSKPFTFGKKAAQLGLAPVSSNLVSSASHNSYFDSLERSAAFAAAEPSTAQSSVHLSSSSENTTTDDSTKTARRVYFEGETNLSQLTIQEESVEEPKKTKEEIFELKDVVGLLKETRKLQEASDSKDAATSNPEDEKPEPITAPSTSEAYLPQEDNKNYDVETIKEV